MRCSISGCSNGIRRKDLCAEHLEKSKRLFFIRDLPKKKPNVPKVHVPEAHYRFDLYKSRAFHRDRAFEITLEQFLEMVHSPCFYCDKPAAKGGRNGVDRVDNAVGYTMSNCVPCCFLCNRAKGRFLFKEFEAEVANKTRMLERWKKRAA